MQDNIENYRKDLEKLIAKGESLFWEMRYECFPEKGKKALGKNAEDIIKQLPKFNEEFQAWYSESKVLIKQLLPDRFRTCHKLFYL